MIAAVTGGSGFIGRRLVAALSAAGHEVRVLSRKRQTNAGSACPVFGGDLTTDGNLAPFVEGCDVLFHCAGEILDQTRMRALHVEGTGRLLAAAGREATGRRRPMHWVQLSSVGAYGSPRHPSEERVVTESSPEHPCGTYEATRTESDELVRQASSSGALTYSILRPSIVFAADMPNGSLRQLAAVLRRRLFFYVGPAGAVATYIHADDVVAALSRCGTDDRAKGQVFNLSNDCPLEAMIAGLARAAGAPAPRLRLPEPVVRFVAAGAGVFIRFPLTAERIDALVSRTRYPSLKLAKALGFTPCRAVPEAIAEVAS